MTTSRLPGLWFYEKAVTDCLCSIVTAGRKPLAIGEELYCETHQRVALVTCVMPAQEIETEELVMSAQEAEAETLNVTVELTQ